MSESCFRSIQDLLPYLRANRQTIEQELGPYHASTDLVRQIRHYECFDCGAKAQSEWPEWKLNFIHEPGCQFVALMRILSDQP